MDDTKTIIKNAFFELSKEKRTDKITVIDICKKAHVSRETFYYHFSDKYDLFKWLYKQGLIERMQTHKNEKIWSDMIKKAIIDAMEYNELFNNVLDASTIEYTEIIFETLYEFYYNELSKNQPNNKLPEHVEAQIYIYLKGGIEYYRFYFEKHKDVSYQRVAELIAESTPHILIELWSKS